MRRKYYFEFNDSEICYSEDYFESRMIEDGIESMVVFEGIPEMIGGGIFWCREHAFCGDDSRDTCGKLNCKQYEPRNGKNGRCKHHNIWLRTHGNMVTLTQKK